MERSLKTKLMSSYVFVAVIATLMLSILANVVFESQFRAYVIKNQEAKNKDIVRSITNAYGPKGNWNLDVLENIGMDAMQNGIILSVYDASGKKLWDAREYNNGVCTAMIDHMSENMTKCYSNWKGGYEEKVAPISLNSIKIGTAKLGYYGPYYFSDNDLLFINTFNKIIIGVGIASLIIAIILGLIIAGSITKPLQRVIKAAALIAKGNYLDRIKEKSKITEINKLTATINDLADNLHKQEKLRKKLTADVAHELRTPLTTLETHMEAMIDGIWEPNTERIVSCHEEVTRINRLVGDLEKLARYDNENLVLDRSTFNLRGLLQVVLTNFQGNFQSKNIELSFTGEDVMLYADKDKITQVAVNLVSNALKYTLEGGIIEVKAFEEADNTGFLVKDNGIGISNDDLPFIFERFYRADKSRSRQTGGAGIGLAITKSIIDAHDGQISVTSTPNQGSEFKVTIKKA